MRKLLLGLVAVLAVGAPVALTSAPAQAAASDTTPRITRFHASPEEFYPTVRDSYRDGVGFDGIADSLTDYGRLNWNITIRNSKGYKVAGRDGSWADSGFWWDWNGRNQHTGHPVGTGRYKATVTVTNPRTGETDAATTTLYARTDTVTRRITNTRDGYETSTRWRHGDCIVTRGGWFDGPNSLYLDCRGGRTGVTYDFVLPRNAKNITWSGNGSHGFGWDGRIIKTGNRTGPKHFRISVTVTGWEAYSIKRANVTYTTTVRR